MRRAVDLARRCAALDLPILLVGPTGTGKEVLAQAIHAWSGRPGELVDVNCGALPPHSAGRELFGHRRGSFTGAVEHAPGLVEAAHTGTLFLDELGALSLEAQAALLRVLETGELRRMGETTKRTVAVRLLGALQALPGGLRDDLRYRLSGGVIQVEPLSRRPEDLWPLAEHFAALGERRLADGVGAVLRRHDWPGNVRELRHVVGRAAILQPAGPLSPGSVAEAIDLGAVVPGGRGSPGQPPDDRWWRTELVELCRAHDYDPERLRRTLGVSRSTLYRRLKEAGLRLELLKGAEVRPVPSQQS